MNSRRNYFLVLLGIFIGAVSWIVISSNFDFTRAGIANQAPQAEAVPLGSDEPVSQELEGLESLSKAFARVIKEVNPTVVTINSEAVVRRPVHPFFDDDFFRRFFDFPEQEREQIMRGLGSGVIVNPEGYILTNNHVISEADEIYVTIDRERYKAEVVGSDPLTDLAVVKIDKKDLKAIRLGDSDALEVGEWVLAIGNPFSNVLQNTVTAGIVSAKGRSGLPIGERGRAGVQYQDFIQTDAAINPGNSGGALVNLRGELVGINTAIVGQANVGIGFAIPISMAKHVMQQLIDEGRVSRGYMGVQIQDLDENLAQSYGLDKPSGALVASVQKDSPAEKAGIKAEDIILRIDDEKIENTDQLRRIVASYAPGTRVDVVVWRDDDEKRLKIKLGELGTDQTASARPRQGDRTAAERLGMEVQNLTDRLAERLKYEGESGVLVASIERNSVADREGIREGDLITAVNRQRISNIDEFNDVIKDLKADDIVLFRLKRGDASLFAALLVPEKD